jgi:chemotaxis protein CheX
MATLSDTTIDCLPADPLLLESMTRGVESCMTMCNMQAKCVGVATVPTREPGPITGMLGVHGDVSGFVTLNMAEKVAMHAVGGLLQEKYEVLTPQVIDGVGEIANILAGQIKGHLSGSKWGFSRVTIPSVIVGKQHQIAFAGGLNFLCAIFEHTTDDTLMLDDRLLQVALSLMRL